MFRDVELFDEAYLAKRSCRSEALVQVTLIALELAREGREGRTIGALFTVGDHAAVLARSRPLILDPLKGHPDQAKKIVAAAPVRNACPRQGLAARRRSAGRRDEGCVR